MIFSISDRDNSCIVIGNIKTKTNKIQKPFFVSFSPVILLGTINYWLIDLNVPRFSMYVMQNRIEPEWRGLGRSRRTPRLVHFIHTFRWVDVFFNRMAIGLYRGRPRLSWAAFCFLLDCQTDRLISLASLLWVGNPFRYCCGVM